MFVINKDNLLNYEAAPTIPAIPHAFLWIKEIRSKNLNLFICFIAKKQKMLTKNQITTKNRIILT